MELPWAENKIIEHSKLLANSFFFWTKEDLIKGNFDSRENSFHLYHAPFVLISHGIENDPVFNYANQKAQELWKLDWNSFTKMPSRLSAEQGDAEERQDLLKKVKEKGFISNYSGERISSKGEKFLIKDTIIWNVIDERGQYRGQAAMFFNYEFL
jgi:hypothetical protein